MGVAYWLEFRFPVGDFPFFRRKTSCVVIRRRNRTRITWKLTALLLESLNRNVSSVSSAEPPENKPMIKAHSQIDLVAGLLKGYAQRGVFRGFGAGAMRGGKATFEIAWHQNRIFNLIFDVEKGTMRFPQLLDNIPADSAMYVELKKFIKSRHAGDLPEHRRIDSQKAQVQPYNRKGVVSLVLRMNDGDCEYGARKFVHLIHEIFVTFLADGNYFEYMVENFDLDPDHM